MSNQVPAFQQRLAELYLKRKDKGLSIEEINEFDQCLELNVKYCWEAAKLTNLSQFAFEINDAAWQQQLKERALSSRN